MFERFTRAARHVVLAAVQECERADVERVEVEHLLLALLDAGGRSAPLLRAAGLSREVLAAEFAAVRRRGGLSGAQAEALGELGIDVAAVVERVERAHGENALAGGPRRRPRLLPGHRPFSGAARDVLVAALGQAREHGDRHIGDEHLLLALAAGTGAAADLLAGHGLSYPEVRAALAKAS